MGFPGKKSGKLIFFIIICLIILIFIFYRQGIIFNTADSSIYSESEFFMDTRVTVKIYGQDKEESSRAVREAFAEMKEWAVRLDRYSEGSIISEINKAGAGGIGVSGELIRLLEAAEKYYYLSDGAFDITIAPLVDLWGFGKEEQTVPSDEEIKKVLSRIDFAELKYSREEGKVYLPREMKLDMGGMAKGYIVDKGIESLREQAVDSALINAGGNIRVIGKKPGNNPWRVGIRKPGEQEEIYQDYILGLTGGSVATSGDYERYFVEEGVKYSHLLDPRTGFPARELRGVTVYAPDALQADILSTAIFIAGWDDGKKLLREIPGVEALIVKEDEIWLTEGFKKLIVE